MPPQRAHRDRTGAERDRDRGRDEPDELAPAGERQEEQAADDEQQHHRRPGDATAVEPGQPPRCVAVAGVGIGKPGRDTRVDQPGVRRRDDDVDRQEHREPGRAQHQREPSERAGRLAAGERQRRPPVRERAVRQRGDECHLQQHVEHRGDQDGADHRERNVALRVLGLTRELDPVAEPQTGERDTRRRDCREHRPEPGRGEPTGLGQIAGMERQHDQCPR